jgi:aspartyl-tRNA(Asn)/glutamyl-tRNA(Gln) amidotransferase subunit A
VLDTPFNRKPIGTCVSLQRNTRMPEDLVHLDVAEAADLIAGGRLSPVELTQAHLRRIEALDGDLGAFLLVTAERAIADAKVAEAEIRQGRRRGPLHGIPFGLKDVYDTAGIATTGNSAAYKDRVPSRDAFVMRKLSDAGAVLLGKQAARELAYGGASANSPWPVPRNPWNRDYDPGGSSSGSGVAVAAGMSMFAMGTDTGGSVRNPAAHCGLTGLKPSFGLIGRSGVMKNSVSLDHCGPLARTVFDTALVLDAVVGYDDGDPMSVRQRNVRSYAQDLDRGIARWKVGVLSHLYRQEFSIGADAEAAMVGALKQLEDLGAIVEEVTIPPVERYARCKSLIQKPEIFEEYRDELAARPSAFGEKFRARVGSGASITASEYLAAQRERRALTNDITSLFDRFDVLVTAGSIGPNTIRDVMETSVFDPPQITVPFSLAGVPTISICIGVASGGIPIAMQIVGPRFGDRAVLRAASAYQHATEWHKRHPVFAGEAQAACV